MQVLLGTRLAADINLIAQMVLLIGLWIGFYYARTRQIPRHANMQTAMVMANVVFIFFVMIPSFYQYVILGGTTGGIVAQLMLLHGVLGLIAQLSGVYLVVRMRTQFLPARFRVRNFKLVMQVTLGLWTVIFVLGIGIYWYRYLVPRPIATGTTSLVKFREAGEVLVGQAEALHTAVIGGEVQAAKGAAEKLINLIEGKTGAHFGDLDKDGSVQGAGDGMGLLDYVHVVKSAAPGGEISARARNLEHWLTAIRDNALTVIHAKDPRAVEAMIEGVVPLAQRAQREGITKLAEMAPPLVIVVMDEYAFNPAKVTIGPGTTVVWINQEAEVHSVMADDGTFDSGDLDRGAVFAVLFRKTGTFPYYCIYHGDRGGVDMAGAVVVE